MLKSRSETLLRGTASLTLIEKSGRRQGLVSSNLQGETRGRNFLSVNRIERQQNLVPARWLIPAKRKAGSRCCTSPGQGLQCTQRRQSCGGDRQRCVKSPPLRQGGRDDLPPLVARTTRRKPMKLPGSDSQTKKGKSFLTPHITVPRDLRPSGAAGLITALGGLSHSV